MKLSKARTCVRLAILLTLVLITMTGCKGTAAPDETGTPSTPDVTVSNEPRAWMALDSTKLQQGDMARATEMCESLMRDSYAAEEEVCYR